MKIQEWNGLGRKFRNICHEEEYGEMVYNVNSNQQIMGVPLRGRTIA